MRAVPRVEFLRHVIATHLDHLAEDDLVRIIEQHPIYSRNNPEWLEDAWVDTFVAVESCYIAHKNFKTVWPLQVSQNFVEFVNGVREKIETDEFPCSKEIKAGIRDLCPPLLASERYPGKFYIYDGQLRLVTLCYHGVSKVRVYLYKGARRI